MVLFIGGRSLPSSANTVGASDAPVDRKAPLPDFSLLLLVSPLPYLLVLLPNCIECCSSVVYVVFPFQLRSLPFHESSLR